MLKTHSLFHFATAFIGLVLASNHCSAQDCPSCPPPTTAASAVISDTTPCNDCGNSSCSGFQLGGSREHPHLDNFKAKWEHHQALNSKIAARNDAWPKPFACADRQLYFSIWDPMIDQGWEEQCVLMSIHFDPETHELNRFGKHTVAGIMQNMPSHRKNVFIHREGDAQVNDARLANVTETLNTFYGHSGPARVEFSSKLPITIRGPQAAAITQMSIEGMQAPVIPIASGESVGSAVGN